MAKQSLSLEPTLASAKKQPEIWPEEVMSCYSTQQSQCNSGFSATNPEWALPSNGPLSRKKKKCFHGNISTDRLILEIYWSLFSPRADRHEICQQNASCNSLGGKTKGCDDRQGITGTEGAL